MANIIIEKGKVNEVILSLNRSTLTNPYYLFVFKSDFRNDIIKKCSLKYNFINNRYILFNIEEKQNGDNLLGELELFTGQWTYEVYESNTQTLNIEDTTEVLLTTDMCIVTDQNYN